ncbi:hypothetical protein PR001_g30722 [Phytophthora rubi]|uniref:Uncharacterized protein n=1 Tax=Phytophthora rubi TaxID=129364 RepID=A0A6A3GKA6_9STRA|nr:hypothetical protein PR001_g30722 [Phytophthora rubi]
MLRLRRALHLIVLARHFRRAVVVPTLPLGQTTHVLHATALPLGETRWRLPLAPLQSRFLRSRTRLHSPRGSHTCTAAGPRTPSGVPFVHRQQSPRLYCRGAFPDADAAVGAAVVPAA